MWVYEGCLQEEELEGATAEDSPSWYVTWTSLWRSCLRLCQVNQVSYERVIYYTGKLYGIGEVHKGGAINPSLPPIYFTLEMEWLLHVMNAAVVVFDSVARVEL